ncbi:helix-turn-helix domain-containing protein [Xylocopilactobacillus apis]|uniref:Transcriptional regulator n=1 Tax=Xylocopilactobacillus apis TaxID=2932183 RepID=A0AAU9D4D2_9LACO|nr:helix-turn-helix domain-containing protein [Xylocopilactobacillus apis]BDR56275.1 transcriptional regulator [Xylocopilactobacillus apis]
MLIGFKITLQRKILNMSQAELADGICTQSTLSKMEQKNIAPMTDTLVKICLRLGLTVNDVLTEFDNSKYQEQLNILDRIQMLFTQLKFDEANKLFNTLDEKNIVKKLSSRYRYVKGNIDLIIKSNTSDAIFNFGIALQEANNNKDDILAANTGIATAYAIKGDVEKAKYYFDQVLSYADNITINKSNITDYLKALNNAAKFYSDNHDYGKSNEISDHIIKTTKKMIALPYVDQSYYRIAYNLFHKDQKKYEKEINDNMEKASIFAEVSGNDELLSYINDFKRNKKFVKNEKIE